MTFEELGKRVSTRAEEYPVSMRLRRSAATLIQRVGLNRSAGAVQISDDYFALKDRLLDMGLKLTFTPKMGYTLSKR